MNDKSVPFAIRRARLRFGMTQMQLAEFFGVDVGLVYRWELGLAHPSPEIWARLRTTTMKASSFLDEDLVRVSPLYKFIVDMDDLTSPIVASKGIIDAVRAVRGSGGEDRAFDLAEIARKSPHYQVSGTRALETIQADPRWKSGEIVYAEAHCLSPALGDVWVDGMVAPLPDRVAALIEFAPSRRGPEGGFSVRLVGMEDMPFNRPEGRAGN
jgi:transcriptional regulator with XRE-family HTH domain